ncbi:MAG: carbon-phosphorus lyase complex subunit PhnI [Verrucomicrobiota bacterium]
MQASEKTSATLEQTAELAEFYRLREGTSPVELEQMLGQMRLLVDRVLSESGLYAPELAAIALKQTEGDAIEAAEILRSHRALLERRYESAVLDTTNMLLERRISSSFREIPGGQVLGPTRDYTQRLLESRIAYENDAAAEDMRTELLAGMAAEPEADIYTFRRVIDVMREQELMQPYNPEVHGRDPVYDASREPVRFPQSRAAALQMLSRAETGALMALGYASQRGYGGGHGTIGELRYGTPRVQVTDRRGRKRCIGRIHVTECEMVGRGSSGGKKSAPQYAVGYGLCFGQNETKAICMGKLESALRDPSEDRPPNDPEYVLYHSDTTDAGGAIRSLLAPDYSHFTAEARDLEASIGRSRQRQEAKQMVSETHA